MAIEAAGPSGSPASASASDECAARASGSPMAILQKGFRPFFFLAAVLAVVAVPVWIAMLSGAVAMPEPLGFNWHAHEMLFGYTVAVIAGFLLTAVANWTKRETLRGAPLLGLALLWVAGRVTLLLTGVVPQPVATAVEVAFLPLLAVALARPLIASRNRRNYGFLALLALLSLADGVSLIAPAFDRADLTPIAHQVALDAILLIVLVVGGRIIPLFTRNATGATDIRNHPWTDRAAVGALLLVTVTDVLALSPVVTGSALLVAAVLSAARARNWGQRHARDPMLWVLHVGYLWVPVGLGLRGWALLSPSIPTPLATHALTVGAIGTLTLGMMARVSLGHTGRPIRASRALATAFGLISAATLTRLVAPLVPPAAYIEALAVSAALWALAFVIFLAVFTPILWSPRADGKAG